MHSWQSSYIYKCLSFIKEDIIKPPTNFSFYVYVRLCSLDYYCYRFLPFLAIFSFTFSIRFIKKCETANNEVTFTETECYIVLSVLLFPFSKILGILLSIRKHRTHTYTHTKHIVYIWKAEEFYSYYHPTQHS